MSKLGGYLAIAAGMVAIADSMSKDLIYDDGKPVPYRKSPLSNKQLKSRKKAKNARKQRKKQGS